MSTIRNSSVLLNAVTTAGLSPVYQFASAYDPSDTRLISGTLTSGDSLQIILHTTATPSGSNTPVTVTHIDTVITSTTFSLVVNGPVQGIQVNKVGTTGPATVIVVG